MNRYIFTKFALGAIFLQLAVNGLSARAADNNFPTDQEKTAYALGMDMGASFKLRKYQVDPDFFGQAFKAALTGGPALLSETEARAVLMSLQSGGPTNVAADDKNFKTVPQEVGCALGTYVGSNMKAMGVNLEVTNIVKGMKDVFAGGPTLLTTNEVKTILTDFQMKVQADRITQAKELGVKNLKEETEFFAKNKSTPGVVSVAPASLTSIDPEGAQKIAARGPDLNGLQYTILTTGKGPIPKSTDDVKVNYRGTFLDGKEFDASPPGQPFTCSLKPGGPRSVISGWGDILQLMPVGSKWKVFIFSDLAYGPDGRPGIPPNAALVFDMELLSIVPLAPAALPTP